MNAPVGLHHCTRVVPARAGLLGNPSDGYGGRVLAFTIGQLAAAVTAGSIDGADETGDAPDDAPIPLLVAARSVFDDWLASLGRPPVAATRLSFVTDIPRQVGLAGSSAIVIGAIEALAELAGQAITPVEVARLALAAETVQLGITAGPQDRVVQANRGVLDMDFARPWSPELHRRLAPEAMPALVVAWQANPGQSSAVVHGDLRRRWDDGDPEVRHVMAAMADLAGQGAAALEAGAGHEVPPLVDAALALRRRLWTLSSGDESLLDVANRTNAAATLAGSGGAIVAVPRDQRDPDAAGTLCGAFEAAGHCAMVPELGPPAPTP